MHCHIYLHTRLSFAYFMIQYTELILSKNILPLSNCRECVLDDVQCDTVPVMDLFNHMYVLTSQVAA